MHPIHEKMYMFNYLNTYFGGLASTASIKIKLLIILKQRSPLPFCCFAHQCKETLPLGGGTMQKRLVEGTLSMALACRWVLKDIPITRKMGLRSHAPQGSFPRAWLGQCGLRFCSGDPVGT